MEHPPLKGLIHAFNGHHFSRCFRSAICWLVTAVKITSIDAFPVSVGVRPELSIVSAAGAHRVSDYILVAVRTGAGPVGFGEANVVPVWSGETQAGALYALREVLAPILLDKDVTEFALLTDLMDRALIGNPFAKAAVEMALLDAAAKILNVPVYKLLGGSRRAGHIPLKFSIGGFPPADAARVARHAVGLGLRAVKVKVGLGVKDDVARVQAVREAVGEGFPLGVDANGGWTENEAAQALPHLERLGVNVLEQPLRRGDFRGCARLRQRTAMPLMLDESVFTAPDALEAIRANACDLISIYPGKNGGLLRSLQIAQMAAAAGLECVIGSNLEWNLGSAAMLQLAVAVPNLSATVAHDIIGPLYHVRQVAAPIRFVDGCAVLPEGPGLGIDLTDELAMAQAGKGGRIP
jgi:L-alanine-DL-glutamate epimerase-like enolase superfamily enzyme